MHKLPDPRGKLNFPIYFDDSLNSLNKSIYGNQKVKILVDKFWEIKPVKTK